MHPDASQVARSGARSALSANTTSLSQQVASEDHLHKPLKLRSDKTNASQTTLISQSTKVSDGGSHKMTKQSSSAKLTPTEIMNQRYLQSLAEHPKTDFSDVEQRMSGPAHYKEQFAAEYSQDAFLAMSAT